MVKRNEIHLTKMLFPISLFGDHLVSGEVPYEQWTSAEKNFANLQIPAHQMCSVNFEEQLNDPYLYSIKMTDEVMA